MTRDDYVGAHVNTDTDIVNAQAGTSVEVEAELVIAKCQRAVRVQMSGTGIHIDPC